MITIKPDSTMISQLQWEPDTKELFVTFKNTGQTFRYSNVSHALWANLTSAESVGQYFTIHIRRFPELYAFEEVKKNAG